jgi:hypothetical protein
MSVLVEIPFVFNASIIRPGHRKEYLVGVADTEPALLREVADAPLVATWGGETAPLGESATVEYRVLDGHLWSTSIGRENNLSVPGFLGEMDRLKEHFIRNPGQVFPKTVWGLIDRAETHQLSAVHPEEVIARADVQARVWVSDDRESWAQIARNRAYSEYAVIGGVVHVRTKGPVFCVYGGEFWGRVSAVKHFEDIGLYSRAGVFTADAPDEAIAFARAAGKATADKTIQAITVLDAGAYRDVCFDPRAEALKGAMRMAVHGFKDIGHLLREIGPEGIRAWADLRRIDDRGGGAWNDNHTAEVAEEALRVFDGCFPVEFLKRTHRTRHPEKSEMGMLWKRADLDPVWRGGVIAEGMQP